MAGVRVVLPTVFRYLLTFVLVAIYWLFPPSAKPPSESDAADLRARAVNSIDGRG